MKRILVVGSGGREHTLVWAISRSKHVERTYAAPGNAGTAGDGVNVAAAVKPPFGELTDFVRSEGIDLTVVGPEQPLVDGMTDAFEKAGLRVFGPRQEAAQLEGSKSFAKEVMEAAGVPTGACEIFDTSAEALAYVRRHEPPLVVKADGLAAGKGVSVCEDRDAAEKAIRVAMDEGAFGDAGNQVLIEEFLEGEEASILALCDGERMVCLPTSQDHKRIYDGDRGPNTGGMGAYSPAPVITEQLQREIEDQILLPTVEEMRRRGVPYRGVLYAGLMITKEGPKVVEFNCRFGDPETQAVLPRVKSDIVELMEACVDGRLPDGPLEIEPGAAVCVVAASDGYPGSYEKGKEIRGLEDATAVDGVVVFHAGTREEGGRIVTSGGRVFGLTATAPSIREAVEKAYRSLGKISFDGMYYRRDIAHRALAREAVG
jgi:phosphoribosylamine--glycine ligase